jgi:ATPase subunit of ABC transporter with duplicated ATPase domains
MHANPAKLVVKDLSISIGQREILSHTQFQLQVEKHYVLVGRNGIGKSSKMNAYLERRLKDLTGPSVVASNSKRPNPEYSSERASTASWSNDVKCRR